MYSLGETAKAANKITRAERNLGGHQSQLLRGDRGTEEKGGMLKVVVTQTYGGGGKAAASSALPMFNPLPFSLHPALKNSPPIG